MSEAAVSVNLIKPNGTTVSLTGTTGSSGTAVLIYKLKKTDPKGTWAVTGTYNNTIASTSFLVQ
jgi:uncharacterized protein YfaS (alpha-2-macroglobulin family)